MRSLAKKYAEVLHFTITDANEYSNMLPIVGLKAGAKTGLSLENPNTEDMFPYPKSTKKLSAKTVEKFLDDIIDGKVKAWKPKGGEGEHEEL